jgi:hypothetical protein
MMGDMKWLTNMALCFGMGALCALLPLSTARGEIFGVKTVYVLPMAGGLDQYLALQLSSSGILQVVTDPKKADAILTDGIGTRLEDSLTELYGAPVEADKSDKDKDKSNAANSARPGMRTLSSSRGLVFLVNRTSRDVLWSTFERQKSTDPEDLRHVAKKIVERLAKANTTK